MKRMKNSLSFLLAFCMLLTAWCAVPLTVSAEGENDAVMILVKGDGTAQSVFSADDGISDSETSRMFGTTKKFNPTATSRYQIGTSAGANAFSTNTTVDFEKTGYKYVNYWLYSDRVLTAADSRDGSAVPTIVLVIGRQSNATNALYYAVPMDWQGWKMFSVKIEDIPSRYANASWQDKHEGFWWNISVNNTSYTNIGNVSWGVNTGNYYCLDYLYLSKEDPNTVGDLEIFTPSVEGTEVSPDLDGSNTFSLTMNRGLATGSAHPDKVTVTKGGEMLNGGYTVAVDETDNSRLNVIFDETLAVSTDYTITFGEGCVYDQYGYPLETATTYSFTTSNRSPVFQVTGTRPGDGAENVPIDLGGERICSIGFSNPPMEAELEQGITLYQNGVPLYGGYSMELQGSQLILRMTWDLQNGTEYTVELADGLQDVYGHTITGNRKFTFSTAPADTGIYVVADFSDDKDFKNLGVSVSGSADVDGKRATATIVSRPEARRSGHVLEYNIPKGSWTSEHGSYGDAILSGRMSASGSIDFANAYKEYKYFNMWVYSDALPTHTNGDTSTLNLYLSPSSNALASNSFCYILPVNWNTGWKLVSVALSDFVENASGSDWDVPITTFGIATNYTGHGGVRWGDGGTVLVDRIYLSKEQPGGFAYMGATLPVGYSGVPVKDAELELAYTNTIGIVNSNAVTVEKNSASVNGFETSVDKNRLIVRFTEDLDCNTRYIVKVSTDIFDCNEQQAAGTAELEFITAAAGISVGKPVIKNTYGNEYTGLPSAGAQVVVEAVASNSSTQSKTATLCVAQYDKNGVMLSITEESSSFAAGSSDVLKAIITRQAETATIRAFVCDDTNNLLRTDYSALGVEDAQAHRIYDAAATVTDNLSLDSAETHVDELNISGSYGGIGAVLLRITDENGKLVLAVPVYANADGKFAYRYTFDKSAISGAYTVSASASGVRTQTLQAIYLNSDNQDTLLYLANSSGETVKISDFLKANESAFGLNGMSATMIGGIAQTISEQKPYNSYGDVLDTMEQAKSMLSVLNSTRWSGMAAFLEKNSDIVLYGNKDYSYYKGLSEESRNLINQTMTKGFPVESFAEFRTLFSNAVADYKKSNMNNQTNAGSNSGGGGGSGGSGGSTSVGFSADIVSEYVNGTSSTAGGENINDVFVDLETSAWAEESIVQLYKMGVISPSEDKKFRPEDSVTRAEFVKLLVAAFGMELKEEDSGFTDAVDGEWYQPYLATARAAGMIEGNPDGSFGIENPITRQDMATMAYRTVTALNKTLRVGAESESFFDAADIAEYARTAVGAIQRAGVINGMGDGSFRPLEQASRAQAAKIISGLLTAIR